MTRTTLILLIIILALLLSLLTCNSCKNAEIAKLKGQQPQKEVMVRVDTVLHTIRDTVTRTKTQLKPYAVYRQKTDTLVQYLGMEPAFELEGETALYSDSVKVQFGKVYINDTLQNNRIAGRSVVTAFNVPTITTTITNTIQQPKRVKGFLTGTLQGSYYQPFGMVGAGFMLQFKNDNAVEVGKLFGRGWQPGWRGQTWQVGYKHKISFR